MAPGRALAMAVIWVAVPRAALGLALLARLLASVSRARALDSGVSSLPFPLLPSVALRLLFQKFCCKEKGREEVVLSRAII